MTRRKQNKPALLFILLTTAACSPKQTESAHFGLYENGEHLVATFNGFMDNFEACQLAATAFNQQSQSDLAAWAAVGKKPDEWVCAKLP